MSKIRVTVWSEGLDPKIEPHAAKCYPNDINAAIAQFLSKEDDLEVICRDVTMEENGLSQEVVDGTDVMLWWSHLYNDQVSDEVAERVVSAVLQRGMGFMILHAGMSGKPAKWLLGRNSAGGKYRECGEKERVWVVNRAHPIVAGLEEDYFELENSEMYGEPYGIPTPDDLIFISWFQGGEVLRSGATWNKGAGRVFFLAPGHEEFPVYSTNKAVQRVITNGVRWLKPAGGPIPVARAEIDSLEPLQGVPFPERLERTKGRATERPKPGAYSISPRTW